MVASILHRCLKLIHLRRNFNFYRDFLAFSRLISPSGPEKTRVARGAPPARSAIYPGFATYFILQMQLSLIQWEVDLSNGMLGYPICNLFCENNQESDKRLSNGSTNYHFSCLNLLQKMSKIYPLRVRVRFILRTVQKTIFIVRNILHEYFISNYHQKVTFSVQWTVQKTIFKVPKTYPPEGLKFDTCGG